MTRAPNNKAKQIANTTSDLYMIDKIFVYNNESTLIKI